MDKIQAIINNLEYLKAELDGLGAKMTYTVDTNPEQQNLNAFLNMIRHSPYVVLDSETTSKDDGEIVEIAVIDQSGKVLVDTLVKPTIPIPADAAAIHGITDADVANAPEWGEVSEILKVALFGQDVVVYNAVFDRKFMHLSAEYAGLPKVDWKLYSRWWCAMKLFAPIYGDWNAYRGNYKWKNLRTAAGYYDIEVGNAHRALDDAKTTLSLVKAMAEKEGNPDVNKR